MTRLENWRGPWREWRVVGNGEGIHGPRLDEDVSVAHLPQGIASGEIARSLAQWLSGRAARPQDLPAQGFVRHPAGDADSVEGTAKASPLVN